MKKLLRNFTFVVTYCASYKTCFGQGKDTVKAKPAMVLSAYVDAYYAYYTDSVGPGKYQKFPAISPRSNSFGVNIVQLTEHYQSDRLRSTATLQFGDLPSAAWSPVFNYIQEANVGVRLAKNLWVDGGFFKTHIGTESLLPKDNITSSVSIITFYEPWWQSGARLVYTADSDRFYSAFYVVNGYNAFVATNADKAFGLALSYNFTDDFSIGYYNFVSNSGNDNDTKPYWRFLNNFVFNIPAGKKVKILAGFDCIFQQNSDILTGSQTVVVLSGILTLKYQCFKKVAVYGRYELFSDPNGVLSGTYLNSSNMLEGYQLQGGTLGVEYKPTGNSYIRLEGRVLNSQNSLTPFYTNGNYVDNRGEVMVDMGAWF